MTYASAMSNLQIERERARAVAARERARHQQQALDRGVGDFLARTKIEVPVGAVDTARVPFVLWPSQQGVLQRLIDDRLIVFLKARQLGISWLTCGFVLHACLARAGQPWLLFSQGQLEANELIRRIALMYTEHADHAVLPPLIKDNTQELVWANGSRVLSLAATKRAGRSFTAAGIVLDEWAFMLWGREVLAAVKPVIDAGGKLIIISTADGQGTHYHQFWNAAESGQSGYTPIFLPWSARPDRDPLWRERKIAESAGDEARVKREYPENPLEAFANASGMVYEVWSHGPADGNVTEAADYVPGGGPVYWAIDDGYEGQLDDLGHYTANSGPRVILLIQERADGRLCVFAEDYAVKTLEEAHLQRVRDQGYPDPDYIAIDSAAAELRGRIHAMGLYTQGKPARIDESVKTMRRMLAADANGWRRILVHPRCKHLIWEMMNYRKDAAGDPIDAHNHGPDALRYLAWTKRLEL